MTPAAPGAAAASGANGPLSGGPSALGVYFLQPVVPHYRVPFFTRLAAQPGLALEVHASPEIPGQSIQTDPTCGPDGPFHCRLHPCRALAGGRLFWQSGLRLPAGFGRGDVFVLPGAPRYPRGFALALEARARGAAVLWFSQGYGAQSTPASVALRRAAARLCDHAVLYTDAEVRGYLAHGFPADRLTGMNNALDQAPIRAAAAAVTPAAVDALRARHALEGRRVLLLVGRLVPKAEASVLLDALAALPPDYAAVLVGDGDERPALEARAAARGLGDRVRFAGALYDEAALAPWFALADAFVFPGAIGLAVLHAFGHGLPAVLHGDRRRHGPEFSALRPGVNGEVFARGDAADLARAVRALCEDPDRRAACAAAARETVAQGWNIDDMVARFAAALRDAAARARARGV